MRNFDDTLDGAAAAFGEGAHAFLFDGGQAAGEIAGRDGILADFAAVALGFLVGVGELLARLRVGGAGLDDGIEADHLDNFLEDGGAAVIDQEIVEGADGGITGQSPKCHRNRRIRRLR